MNAVPVKDQLQEPVKGLRPACSVGPVAASGGHGNERLLRRYSLKGCRHDVVTREHPSGGLGQVRVGVSPKANGWLDCRHQAGRAHGNGRWRSGRNCLASWIRNNRVGDHVGKVLGFPLLYFPVATNWSVPPMPFTLKRPLPPEAGVSVMDCKWLVVPQPSMLNTSSAQANAAKRVLRFTAEYLQ
jgi:hypothetical protein